MLLGFLIKITSIAIGKELAWINPLSRYSFKYLKMPFSLANAPSLFQHFINNTLRPYLDIFYTTYINNILIYSNNLAEYWKYIYFILKALCGASLQLNINKYKFHKTEVLYFGLIISINGV